MEAWSAVDAAQWLRVPDATDDKFSRGVLGLRTGSPEYPGAAVLGVEGAWRAGAGLVRWVGDPAVGALVLQRRPETVLRPGRAAAWVIGSGTDPASRSPWERDALRELLAGSVPVVVDAGALDLVQTHAAPVVVTPHEREFERLAAMVSVVRTGDRAADAAAVARALDAVVLLKGSATLVADPDGSVVLVDSGTPWLATAGTGDVLAGIIGAVVASTAGASLLAASATGAYLHGRAARLAAHVDDGARPITALEVARAVPAAFAAIRHEAAAQTSEVPA